MSTFVLAGDPEAMRATARALVAQADGIRLAPEGPIAGFEALVLEGPAAGRLRVAAGEVRQHAERAASDLETVAAALYADAATVEQMNEDRRQAAAQAAADAQKAAAAADAQKAAEAAKAAAAAQTPAPGAPSPLPAPAAPEAGAPAPTQPPPA
jgi:hypothetical protein